MGTSHQLAERERESGFFTWLDFGFSLLALGLSRTDLVVSQAKVMRNNRQCISARLNVESYRLVEGRIAGLQSSSWLVYGYGRRISC